MTDRELLENAAKAAGIEIPKHLWKDYTGAGLKTFSGIVWSPLSDDGDAFRLAVKLGINKGFGFAIADARAVASISGGVAQEENIGIDIDPYAATRRAIVRAAAEIGGTL